MNTQLEPTPVIVSVSSRFRVYILFTTSKIPIWSQLIRLGLRMYQGSKPNYTHCFVAVQDMVDKVLMFYEIEYGNSMVVYDVPYDVSFYCDGKLSITLDTFYGERINASWDAIDVTAVTSCNIQDKWNESLTKVKLTPWTLLKHLFPWPTQHTTWTCSGLTMVLLGHGKYEQFVSPSTPDQVYVIFSTKTGSV
jgi:hypothetical protein